MSALTPLSKLSALYFGAGRGLVVVAGLVALMTFQQTRGTVSSLPSRNCPALPVFSNQSESVIYFVEPSGSLSCTRTVSRREEVVVFSGDVEAFVFRSHIFSNTRAEKVCPHSTQKMTTTQNLPGGNADENRPNETPNGEVTASPTTVTNGLATTGTGYAEPEVPVQPQVATPVNAGTDVPDFTGTEASVLTGVVNPVLMETVADGNTAPIVRTDLAAPADQETELTGNADAGGNPTEGARTAGTNVAETAVMAPAVHGTTVAASTVAVAAGTAAVEAAERVFNQAEKATLPESIRTISDSDLRNVLALRKKNGLVDTIAGLLKDLKDAACAISLEEAKRQKRAGASPIWVSTRYLNSNGTCPATGETYADAKPRGIAPVVDAGPESEDKTKTAFAAALVSLGHKADYRESKLTMTSELELPPAIKDLNLNFARMEEEPEGIHIQLVDGKPRVAMTIEELLRQKGIAPQAVGYAEPVVATEVVGYAVPEVATLG